MRQYTCLLVADNGKVVAAMSVTADDALVACRQTLIAAVGHSEVQFVEVWLDGVKVLRSAIASALAGQRGRAPDLATREHKIWKRLSTAWRGL